mgnify:CR=1 FL=1
MKRIFTILMAVLVASTVTIYDAEAQSILFGIQRDTTKVRRKPGGLIQVNRIDREIDKAREDMERAAKSLDFLAAARYRDRMYELQKLRESL